MKFGINEVFDSLEVAFDGKKVSIAFVGILLTILVSLVSAWVGTMASNAIVYVVLQIVSFLILLAIIACADGAVGYMAYKDLTMGEKLSIKDGLAFSKNNIKTLLLTPITIGIVFIVLFFVEYLILLLAKIPALQIVLSIFTIPVVLFNAILILAAVISVLMMFAIIAVDASGPVSNAKKIYSLVKNAPLQTFASIILSVIIAAPVLIGILLLLFGADVISVALFGSASGIFADMAAMDIPVLAGSAQISWAIFAVFASLLSLYAFSYVLTVIHTCAVNVYLSLKEKIK